MNGGVRMAVAMMLITVIVIPNIMRAPKNYVIKESKIITLNKNQKGTIVYQLKKGRYKIRISPNVEYVDQYIVGKSAEFNPTIDGETFQYEIDTNRKIERFKQEYNSKKNLNLKIEIEKIE